MLCETCGVEMYILEPLKDTKGNTTYASRGWKVSYKDIWKCPKCLHCKVEPL